MNKDQVKGTAHTITGKVQESTGKTIGNHTLELKGIRKQALGSAEKAIGDAKQGGKNLANAGKDAISKY